MYLTAYDIITPTLEHTCILQLMIVLLPHWSIHVSYMAYDSITPTLEHTCILELMIVLLPHWSIHVS